MVDPFIGLIDSRLYLDILKLLYTLQDLFKLRSTSCLKVGSMIVDKRIQSDTLFDYQLWPQFCDCLLKGPVTCTVFTNISLKIVIALTEGVGLIQINCFSMNFGLRSVTVSWRDKTAASRLWLRWRKEQFRYTDFYELRPKDCYCWLKGHSTYLSFNLS